MQKRLSLQFLLLLTGLAWFSSCTKNDELVADLKTHPNKPVEIGFTENDVILEWNENVGRILSVTPAPPPILARHYMMAQIAVHDALNSIKPKYETYGLVDYRDNDAHPDAAVVSAAYWTLKDINAYLLGLPAPGLPLQSSGNNWDQWYADALAEIPDGPSKDAGIELGRRAATAIMARRSTDGYAQARFVYVPTSPSTPAAGIWRPTITSGPPVPASHMGGLPYWAQYMQGVSIENASDFRPAAPPALSSAQYAEDYNEVKSLGARVNSTRTADQSVVAKFWQENMSVIWNRYTRNTLQYKKTDAWRSARLLALVNTAIFDAFLASFDGLYHYYAWRPESAIRATQDDGNSLTDTDGTWLPFVTDIKLPVGTLGAPTPPIPEYPNPNAAMGDAVAEVLKSFFGTDQTYVSLVTRDVETTGTTRVFTSFDATADEFALSRIYAGFNFRYSIEAGQEMGTALGQHVYETMFREK
jgi:hypothetical protein